MCGCEDRDYSRGKHGEGVIIRILRHSHCSTRKRKVGEEDFLKQGWPARSQARKEGFTRQGRRGGLGLQAKLVHQGLMGLVPFRNITKQLIRPSRVRHDLWRT